MNRVSREATEDSRWCGRDNSGLIQYAQTSYLMSWITQVLIVGGHHHHPDRFTLCVIMPVTLGEIEAAVRAAIESYAHHSERQLG